MTSRVLPHLRRSFPVSCALAVGGVLLTASATGQAQRTVPITVRGVVAASNFTPPANGGPSATSPSHYQGALVCVDGNANGVCDPDEASDTTDSTGRFQLHGLTRGDLVAEIPVGARSSEALVTERTVFRAALRQVDEGGASFGHAAVATPAASEVVISPLSTEVARMMEDDGIDFDTAKQHLAQRLAVAQSDVLLDPSTVLGATQTALLTESVILTRRFAFAARMVDRHDVSPAALKLNPQATGPAITIKEAQQAAMNLELIPRYDHLFVIILENKASSSIVNSTFAPRIDAYLAAGNQFTSYYATGRPSEPNYTAIAAADDFGITDDSRWNCLPANDLADAPEDPLPPGIGPCVNPTNHNIKHRPNLLTALEGAGMTWRVYNESINPGRDVRLDGVSDPTLLAADHVYPAGSPVGAIGNASLMLPFPSGLYATKHNPSMPFQDIRSAHDFFTSNRTMGGGQWDDAIRHSPNTPGSWDVDQLGTDLQSGDVGNLNFLVPDQCDDMHGVTVRGVNGVGTASDCGGNANILRGDLYTDALIKKIQASPIWQNQQKRVGIVIMFDEGTATIGFNSCCGWNHTPGESLGPVVKTNGVASNDTSIVNYVQGNQGHGPSIFGVLTNQPKAPKGIVDSDAYSHISLVRTLQDMFQVADPGDEWSYMNRAKYTEAFIAAHLALLPEYAGSTDRHFDAVRPMNHAFVIPNGYVQKNGFPVPQVGPDANQINVWALK
jgi:hypothetical protein